MANRPQPPPHPMFNMMAHDLIVDLIDQFWWNHDRAPGISLVVILRGLPGTGKSTFASLMKLYASTKLLATTICSADDFFDREHGYRFDVAQLPQAHGYCLTRFQSALTNGVPVVLVDNTNVLTREFEPYVNAAIGGGHQVHLVNFSVGTLEEAHDLNARGVHGVPDEVIERRFDQYKHQAWQPTRLPYRIHEVDPIWNSWEAV